jgi:hypothetical protein
MIETDVNRTNEHSLRRKAEELGIDISTIIDDLKKRISSHNNQGEYFTYSKGIVKEFLQGIVYYLKKYELQRTIIGHIVTDGPGDLSIWIDTDGNIEQECPTCMGSKIVDSDYMYSHLNEPTQIVSSLMWRIIKDREYKRNELERYCSSFDEL